MNSVVKRKNTEKVKFFTKCRSQFLRLNRGLDHTQKWHIYQKVKGHVKTPELYFAVKNTDQLPKVADLPDKFCVKGNKGEQGQEILLIKKLEGGKFYDTFHKKKYCVHSLSRKWKNMLQRNGMIIFEEWLQNKEQGGIPFDYKIHVLNGKVFSMFTFDRNGKVKYLTILDKNFNVIPAKSMFVKTIAGYNFNDPRAERMIPNNPEDRKKLTDTALKLWEVFNKPYFTRFDLYLIDGEVYFGEVTVICGGMKIGMVKPEIIREIMVESPWK